MATVVLQNLTKTFPGKAGLGPAVVKGINLEIQDREFMVLVGPSGCGKSTTLRMIAGLEEISAGSVSIDGEIVNHVAPKDRDIAMVFQNYALYPHMTVYENMAFGLQLRRLPKAEIDTRVRDAAQMLGLEPYLDRKPKALSGGQRQRVAVGRAIVRKPRVFLFDEPLSNLDAQMRVSTRAEIAKLHARLGGTMIYVTHDQVEAMTLGDRICVMNEGRIMQVGEPLGLYDCPENRFVAGFIGSPPMSFVKGVVRKEGGRIVFAEDNSLGVPMVLALAAEHSDQALGFVGRPVVLGIRPQDVRPARAASPDHGASADLRIEVCEPMGSETFLTLTNGSTALIARAPSADRFAVGHSIRVEFEMRKAHFFGDDGERLVSRLT